MDADKLVSVPSKGKALARKALRKEKFIAHRRIPRPKVPVGKCIFCSGSPLTKEHVFADWIGEILPRTQARSYHNCAYEFEPRQKFTQGRDLLSQKLKIVCGNCNTRWMSQLQNEAKPIVERLIRGEQVFLNSENLDLLKAWITMTVMVSEYWDPILETITTHQKERSEFMHTRQLPAGWHYWLGYFAEHDGRFYNRTAAGLYVGEQAGEVSGPHRAHATTFAVGHLAVHVFFVEAIEFRYAPEQSYCFRHLNEDVNLFSPDHRFSISDSSLRSISEALNKLAEAHPFWT